MAPKRGDRRPRPQAPLPDRIFANASPRSRGGRSLFAETAPIVAATVSDFLSDDAVRLAAAAQLLAAGFEVLRVGPTSINIAGSADTYREAFGRAIVRREEPVLKPLQEQTTATFLDVRGAPRRGLVPTDGTPFEDVLEGVALEEPRFYMGDPDPQPPPPEAPATAGPSPLPPRVGYWHLELPAGVSLGCNADRAHRAGVTGRGVRVAMVDSGWYRHPFFEGRGYRAAPVVLGPAASAPERDESGHGTGESANVFAVAPDAELLPVKANFVNTKGAFDAAVALEPDVITCSWGSSRPRGPLTAADQALAASIAAAVAAGIVVVFSAGNGHWGFPGQHPDVISAGGAFLDADGGLRASDYASGFRSAIYPGRRVPDLCGLVGLQPRAIYLMLPVEPGDSLDRGLAGGEHPAGDETGPDDGWAAFSGTSAAAPQLAGAAALLLQAHPALTPDEVRELLRASARDVSAGTCHPNTGGSPATVGPDDATGHGLLDAHRATVLAKLRAAAAADTSAGVVAPAARGPGAPRTRGERLQRAATPSATPPASPSAAARLAPEDVAELEAMLGLRPPAPPASAPPSGDPAPDDDPPA